MQHMKAIRHSICDARLFDSRYPCLEVPAFGAGADVNVRCVRCSRRQKSKYLVGSKIRLPRWVVSTEPKPVLCQNVSCLHRITDIALQIVYVHPMVADLVFFCPRCKGLTGLQLEGIGRIETLTPQ